MKKACTLLLLTAFNLGGFIPFLYAEAESPKGPKWNAAQEKMRRDSEGLKVIRHPEGRRSIDLDGRFTHMSALVRDESGQFCQHCFDNFQAMDKAIRGNSRVKQSKKVQNEVAEK
ncbi:hypothetical protein G0Q06_05990 [Puniceicoccales bacterium CK1056]|uniref:Uncharacterized protein n=1 Tax=Oceanipulchritudo coccoides TaxID=2706888 RepID=A0A6B2M2G9_9BACT|nr:hypothetical protein [Oceanipulchritudo coccoides]NDV61995.1 hypothetical protein [Oceanipulchritudo coccoides]